MIERGAALKILIVGAGIQDTSPHTVLHPFQQVSFEQVLAAQLFATQEQELSDGVEALQEPLQSYVPLFLCPQEFADDEQPTPRYHGSSGVEALQEPLQS
ncbi:MAG: hypothetical protein WA054_01250 [Candidatus Moraniibacteriota bacterium]